MKINKLNIKFYLLFVLAFSFNSFADNPGEEDVATEEVVAEEAVSEAVSDSSVQVDSSSGYVSSGDIDEVVVTGSRIRKSTFTSISPLQIITGEISREAGLIDPATILQESTAATGQQIDQSFQGFVLDNGPGASTISLRGLGAGRTLLLINGRRVGPGGVEGAPTSPDLNLLPGGLIERYDLLLDGASSVYGSDAVGGVTNVILRSDFDGWEAEMYVKNSPYQKKPGGHDDHSFTLTYGTNSDRWFFGAGLEIAANPHVRLSDRPWTSDCETNYEITTDGDIRTADLYWAENFGFELTDCKFTSQMNTYVPVSISNFGFGTGFLSYQDGYQLGANTPVGWNVWSSNGIFGDYNGDGRVDTDISELNANGADTFSTLFSDLDRMSFMAYGEYNLEGEGNHTLFFEAQYGSRETYSIAGGYQLFPYIPANNPFNLCNPAAANGIDCGEFVNAINSNPNFVNEFNNTFNGWGASAWDLYGADYFADTGLTVSAHSSYCGGYNAAGEFGPSFYSWYFGAPTGSFYEFDCFPMAGGGEGPLPSQAIVSVIGDRTEVETDVMQTRYVLGIRGDLDLPVGSAWSYEAVAYSTESRGKSYRAGVRDDKLKFALGFDPSAPVVSYSSAILNPAYALAAPCDPTGIAGEVRADVLEGCVPVNMSAPSLYNGIIGEFATQAEKNYLFSTSVFTTTFTQEVVSAYVSGNLFELPAGSVGAVVGVEMRKDEIISDPDPIRDQGLFFGFAANGGARGDQDVKEGFFELAIPVLAGKFLAEELNLEVSGRFTDIETTNHFTNAVQSANGSTYSAKLGYRPINDLLIRATVGTSYRAPNLREVALRAESGFASIGDPCNAAPYFELNEETNQTEYNASLDSREATLIENCISAGVDPYTLGWDAENGQAISTTSVEVVTGGSTDLDSETSKSTTFGFVYDLPVNFAGISLGASWYDIEVEDAIIEPSGAYAVYDCYIDKAGFTSTFCGKIERSSVDGLISKVNSGFLNRDLATARGVDVNLRIDKPFTFNDRVFDWGLDINANNMIERTLQFTSDEGNPDVERYEGEPGYPDWTASARTFLGYGDWRLAWQTSYIGRVDQDPDFVDTFSNVFGTLNADGVEVSSDTCLGPDNGDVNCRDIGFIKSQVTHNVSLYYFGDTFTVGFGVRNAFDKHPPKVDGSEISSYSNVPIGYGYNILGKEYFFNISKAF